MNLRISGLFFVLFGFTACGQGTDPLTAVGDPSRNLAGSMTLPVTSQITTLQGAFNSSNNGFILQGNNWTIGAVPPVLAPVSGVVTQVDLGAQSITIMANSRVSVQLTGVSGSFQAGSFVNQGSQIGVASTTLNYIKFSVFVDGTAVCPLSYLSSTARQQMYSFYTTNPCL